MPPSVVGGTVPLPSQHRPLPRISASSSPPLAPRPRQKLSPGLGATGAPSAPPEERTAVQSPRHNFTQPVRHPPWGAHPSPQPSGRVWISPGSGRRGSPAAGTLLPARRRAAGSEPCAAARLPLCCGGGSCSGAGSLADWRAARLSPRRGFLWGWTKDISWEEQGTVPSMPRFVVPGDFLPPQHPRPDGDPGTRGRRCRHPYARPGREDWGSRPGPGPALRGRGRRPGVCAPRAGGGPLLRGPRRAVGCGKTLRRRGLFFRKEEVAGGLTCLLIIFFLLVPFFFKTSRILRGGGGRRGGLKNLTARCSPGIQVP